MAVTNCYKAIEAVLAIIMKANNVVAKGILVIVVNSVAMLNLVQAAGIPEPPLIFYGSISNSATHALGASLKLVWSVDGEESTSNAFATVASINGEYFYITRIPLETRFAGVLAFPAQSNTLPLTSTPRTFLRTAVVNGFSATLMPPATSNFTFSKAHRGRIERVNLIVDLPPVPDLDSDGDGMPDWMELIAGTDPNDPNSVFAASTDIQPAAEGGLILKWSSVAGKSYSVHRTTDVNEAFTPLATEVPGNPPENQFTDSTATGSGPYFYRIQLEE